MDVDNNDKDLKNSQINENNDGTLNFTDKPNYHNQNIVSSNQDIQIQIASTSKPPLKIEEL